MNNRPIKFRGKDKKPRIRTKGAYNGIVKIGKYLYVYIPSHPQAMHGKRYVALHRLVKEWAMGCPIPERFIVHHVDGDTLNNHPDNLQCLSVVEHNILTARNRKKDAKGKFK